MLSAQAKWDLLYEPSEGVRYHLLEVDDAELQRTLEDGDEISFKGDKEDPLTLCTSKNTYQVQQLCISNSQLLCIQDSHHIRMISNTSYRLEPKVTTPNFKKLQVVLDETIIDLPDETPFSKLTRYVDVYSLVPASDQEVDKFLKKQGAMNLDGFVRKPSPKLLGRFFEVLMLNAAIEEKKLQNCTVEDCKRLLSDCEEFPLQITNHILELFKISEREFLDTKAVCQMYARQILTVQNKILLSEFERLWQNICADFEPEIEMLSGIAIIEGTPSCVCLFDRDSLPSDPELRFSAIFLKRSKWPWDELKVYIHPLLDHPNDDKICEALMVKYCRISTDKDQRMATSKIPLQSF